MHQEQELHSLINKSYLEQEYPTLNDIQKVKIQQEQTPEEEQIQQIIHKIEMNDTLEGLSLQYNVPVNKIKTHNNLTSNQIYYLKALVIPNPTSFNEQNKISAEEMQKIRRQFILKGFMNELQADDKCVSTAKYYLDSTEWNIYKAAKLYKEDRQWEKNNPQLKPMAISNQQTNIRQIRKMYAENKQRNYPDIELVEKKTK